MSEFHTLIKSYKKIYLPKEVSFSIEIIEEDGYGDEGSPSSYKRYCSYLIFHESCCPEITNFLWNNRHILDELDWNHGITLSEFVTITEDVLNKSKGKEFETFKKIRVGDDYQHYWDEIKRSSYDMQYIQYRISQVANQLIEILKEKGVIENAKEI